MKNQWLRLINYVKYSLYIIYYPYWKFIFIILIDKFRKINISSTILISAIENFFSRFTFFCKKFTDRSIRSQLKLFLFAQERSRDSRVYWQLRSFSLFLRVSTNLFQSVLQTETNCSRALPFAGECQETIDFSLLFVFLGASIPAVRVTVEYRHDVADKYFDNFASRYNSSPIFIIKYFSYER